MDVSTQKRGGGDTEAHSLKLGIFMFGQGRDAEEFIAHNYLGLGDSGRWVLGKEGCEVEAVPQGAALIVGILAHRDDGIQRGSIGILNYGPNYGLCVSAPSVDVIANVLRGSSRRKIAHGERQIAAPGHCECG